MKKLILAAAVAGTALMFAGVSHAQAPDPGRFMTMLKAADTNKDGKVSKAEMIAARTAEFASLDKNKDGFLSADELGPRAQMISRADANKDGKIDKAEFTNVDMMFQRMDKNGDGSIDLSSELPSGPPG